MVKIMKQLSLIIILLILNSSVLAQPVTPTTLIHAGTVITGVDKQPLHHQTLIVKGDRIVDIEAGFRTATAGEQLVDLKKHTVLPGLMDMHTHLSFEHSKNSYSEQFTLNEADYAYRSVGYARNTLMAGFTTVRDLGDNFNITVALRKAINNQIIEGPRIYAATQAVATTGGHGDPTNGYRHGLLPAPQPEQGVINGVADAREAVRQRYKDGADLIKVTATGGVLSLAKNGQNPQLMDDELEAVVQTAKDYGFTVAVHAHGTEGMKRAIKAGVDSIEHGTYMTEEVIRLMKKHGTYYVPTILAGEWVTKKAAIDGFFPAVVRPKAAAIGPLIQATFSRAYKANVKIAFGTDSGVSKHGDNAQEFSLMVEAGMPPMEAIQSATIEAAKLLKISNELGSLEKGKLADIVAVEGNPLDNIRLLENVAFVMKAGKIYKQQ